MLLFGCEWVGGDQVFAASIGPHLLALKKAPAKPVKAKASGKASSKKKKSKKKEKVKLDPNAPKMKSLFWDVMKKAKQTRGTLFEVDDTEAEETKSSTPGSGDFAVDKLFKDLTKHFARIEKPKSKSKKSKATSKKPSRVRIMWQVFLCVRRQSVCELCTKVLTCVCVGHVAQPQVLDGKLHQNMNIALNRVSRIPMTSIANAIQNLDMSSLGDTETTRDMVRLFLTLDCYDGTAAKNMAVRQTRMLQRPGRRACVHACLASRVLRFVCRIRDSILPTWTSRSSLCTMLCVVLGGCKASWSASSSCVR